MTYLEQHNESGFKLGDHVKVMRRARDQESGWEAIWRTEMDPFIGKECIIIDDRCGFGFRIALKEEHDIGENNGWLFPFFVLERWDAQPMVDMSKYNTTCRVCGKPAYQGLNSVECSGGCK